MGQFSKFADEYQDVISAKTEVASINGIINLLLPYVLSGAGLILFFMLLSGGFTMLTAVSDPKKAEAGKQRITTAIIGFIIVFAAYWITQFLEIVLGVNIL